MYDELQIYGRTVRRIIHITVMHTVFSYKIVKIKTRGRKFHNTVSRGEISVKFHSNFHKVIKYRYYAYI